MVFFRVFERAVLRRYFPGDGETPAVTDRARDAADAAKDPVLACGELGEALGQEIREAHVDASGGREIPEVRVVRAFVNVE